MTSRPNGRARSLLLLLAPIALTAVLFIAPILTMAAESFRGAEGLTFEHYQRFFGDSYYLEALATTLGTAILVMVLTAVVSFPLAYSYWQARGRLRSLLVILLLSPFYANVVVKVFGWMVILPADFLNSYLAVVLVSVHRAMPFMVLTVASALDRIDPEILESARTCGAPGHRVFRTVIAPLSLPGLISGGIVVFSLTIAAFVVPQLIGGTSRGRFLPVLLYQQITIAQNWGFGAAIAMILLVVSLLTIATGNRLARSGRLGQVTSESDGG